MGEPGGGEFGWPMDVEYAKFRLEEWGKWARVSLVAGLSYPSRSPENREIWGGHARFEPDNESEHKVDKIVLQMTPKLRDVTVLYYVRRWRLQDIAKKMRANRAGIQKLVEGAAWYVAAKLN